MSEARYRIEHVRIVPAGWHVRTVRSGAHQVRVAFPPGARTRGAGQVVEVLHPRGDNPCRFNPAELVILGNPARSEKLRAARERSSRIRATAELHSGNSAGMKHGLHIKFSPVNNAYFLMWHGTVLRIGSKADMEYEKRILLRGVDEREKEASGNPVGPSLLWGEAPPDLMQLWHTARIAGAGSRGERLQWAAKEWSKTHPGERLSAYKALDRATRGYGNPSVPEQHQIKIAKQTLRMSDPVAHVMGGMTKEKAREILRKHGITVKENPILDSIRAGDRVTILVPAGIGREGQEYTQKTGRAVMRGPHGWVLNMGGPHGTPAVASDRNIVKVHRRGNPDEGDVSELEGAIELFEEFHGADPKGIAEAQRSAAMRLDYVALGPLLGVAPYVEGLKLPSPEHWDDGGYPVLQFSGVKLASNADGTQLYAIEGDQDLADVLAEFPDVDVSKDLVDLGEVAYVTYEARKSLDNFELVQYTHEFDEPRPRLGYDQVKHEIFFVGGRYEVNAPGIEH